jgi:hypothetical protein
VTEQERPLDGDVAGAFLFPQAKDGIPTGMKDDVERTVQKTLQMGLGEAIQRLMRVELLRQKGLSDVPEQLAAERDMIVAALNTHQLDLGFDCNADGVPDDVSIFAKSAQTSCCRIVPTDSSRARRQYVSPRRKGA